MLLEVKAAGAYGWQPTTITVPLSQKLGALTFLNPSGPAWTVGDDFTFTFTLLIALRRGNIWPSLTIYNYWNGNKLALQPPTGLQHLPMCGASRWVRKYEDMKRWWSDMLVTELWWRQSAREWIIGKVISEHGALVKWQCLGMERWWSDNIRVWNVGEVIILGYGMLMKS